MRFFILFWKLFYFIYINFLQILILNGYIDFMSLMMGLKCKMWDDTRVKSSTTFIETAHLNLEKLRDVSLWKESI